MFLIVIMVICISSASAAEFDNEAIGDDVNASVSEEKLDVELDAKEQYGIYGNGDTKLKVFVRDSNGKNVSEGSLTFLNVFDKNYTVNVSGGVASAKVFVGQIGKFNISCKYSGSGIYNNATTKFLLTVPVANTTCQNIRATEYGNYVFFSGNMESDYRSYQKYGDFDDYEEVTRGNVTVYVDGEMLGNCSVDINGNFVYVWNTTRNLIGQTINFKGVFRNNLGQFNSSNFTKNFTFAPPVGTEISPQVFLIDLNNFLITGTVYDSSKNNVIGGKIIVNNHTVFVDSKGKFRFYLTKDAIPKANYEIGVIDWGSKDGITVNIPLMNALDHTPLTDELIELCKKGSPYVKFGNGNGKTVVVNVGTHGGELASIVAGFKLINFLADYGGEIDGTIYVFPVLFPQSTANNTRTYNGINLNEIADVDGTISNNLIKFAKSVNASGLGDFHCTRHSASDVGITCVMCTLKPTYESYLIASFIHNETGYDLKKYDVAGVPYAGAVEDSANLMGLPAITSESLTNHGVVEYGSTEKSFNMMRAFLRYFGFDIDEMTKIPLKTRDSLVLTFETLYNYTSSSVSINGNLLKDKAYISAKTSSYIINYGGKYSITLKDSKGNALQSKKVTFTLNGKYIGSANTNKNGVATIQLTLKILKTAKAGKGSLVMKFSDDNYNSASKTVKISINKEKTRLYAKSKSFKKSTKIKKYTVTLKNSKKKVMKGVKVYIKVNAKTYVAKTNSKGKATFKIKKLTKKGKYKAKVTYKGNRYYNKVTKNVKITVK